MGLPQPVKRFTPQEYYDLEKAAESKSDFYEGEIFAMAGGTNNHSLIVMNISGELRARLKGKPCAPRDPNIRVKVKATSLRTYPDVSVFCAPVERDEEDPSGTTFTNPSIIFEVLSKTTEAYDRGFKFANYRQIESLQTYVLVSQGTPQAEMYERSAAGLWVLREAQGLGSSLTLIAAGVDLPLSEIYDRVDFSIPDE